MALIKLSICLLFQQVFPARVLHTLSWILLAVILSWSTGSILFELLACRPLTGLWSTSTTHASAECIEDRTIPYMVMGVGDIVIDTATLIIGAIGVWKLEVSTRNVLALGFLFSMGPCVMAMSTLRTIALIQASALFETLTESYFVIWSIGGAALCQFVVCAPFFPLLRSQNIHKRSGDIELRTLSSQFHCVGELDGESDEIIGALGGDWAVRVERGANEHGSYIFTHMLESGHWNTTLRSDEDGSKSDSRSWVGL
ncbi:unnamed protein product [Periconia digitata]|uniref:Rhodopsin domain-containing protein n=1 Tax=Periconia digitata TaxID=1303443 RepID=A0A9W4ULR5_9PLEO|nr:unnamed protein product [Periconia digitata]